MIDALVFNNCLLTLGANLRNSCNRAKKLLVFWVGLRLIFAFGSDIWGQTAPSSGDDLKAVEDRIKGLHF
jgi:hypothetical protein